MEDYNVKYKDIIDRVKVMGIDKVVIAYYTAGADPLRNYDYAFAIRLIDIFGNKYRLVMYDSSNNHNFIVSNNQVIDHEFSNNFMYNMKFTNYYNAVVLHISTYSCCFDVFFCNEKDVELEVIFELD